MQRLLVFLFLVATASAVGTALHKNSKIAIIGAGPAGIHMASLLSDAGFKTVTIYEKSERIGGKSWSVPDEEHEGVFHETGTVYTHPAYYPIFELLERYVGSDQVVDFSFDYKDANGVGWRAVYDETIGLYPNDYYPFYTWLEIKTSASVTPAIIGGLLPYLEGAQQTMLLDPDTDDQTKFILMLTASVYKYNDLHRSLFGDYEGTIIPRPSEEALARITTTYFDYLLESGLDLLIPMLSYTQTAQGYGYLESVPALYGLWWQNPAVMTTMVASFGGGPALTGLVKGGYSNLWESIADSHDMNIVFNADISSIERTGGKVKLELEGCLPGITPQSPPLSCSETYDHLIVAAPQKDLIREGVLDASAEELQWFTNQARGLFVTTIVEVGFTEFHSITFPTKRVLDLPLSFSSFRNSQASLFPETNADRGEGKPARIVTYQYDMEDDTVRAEEARQKLETGLNELGTKLHQTILQVNSPYFPHFTEAEIKAGVPWDIQDWNLDNTLNTWHIGSSVSFESVLDTTNYNTWLWGAFAGGQSTGEGEQGGQSSTGEGEQGGQSSTGEGEQGGGGGAMPMCSARACNVGKLKSNAASIEGASDPLCCDPPPDDDTEEEVSLAARVTAPSALLPLGAGAMAMLAF